MITNAEVMNASALSSLVYGDKIELPGFKKIKIISDKDTDTQGCVLVDQVDKKLYIVFRGTASQKDILIDIECIQKKTTIGGKECRIHNGFLKSYESVEPQINSILFGDYPGYDIVICGHSLGGALATICGASLPVDNKISVVTFGSPRVGNNKLVKIFNLKVGQYYRFVHHSDIVPMVPKINYKHAGKEIRLDSDGDEISYFNVWKRLLYWIKGKGKFNIALFSIEDHFMDGYIKTVIAWCNKH